MEARLLLLLLAIFPVQGGSSGACPGGALLQRRGDKGALSVTEDLLAIATSTLPQTQHLPPDASIQDVKFTRTPAGATVVFSHNFAQFTYELAPSPVFAKAALAVRHTANGTEYMDVLNCTTFSSREPGQWATVTIQDDHGSVAGLFQHHNRVLRIVPVEVPVNGSRSGIPHLVHSVPPPVLGAMDLASAKSPRSEESSALTEWTRKQWWGGCYPSDSEINMLSLNVVADFPFFQKSGKGTRAKLEHAVAEASFLLEMQLHIRLEIAYFVIYESQRKAPGYARTCPSGEGMMHSKLEELTAVVSGLHFQTATHMFTGCGDGTGIVGAAWLGMICDAKYSRAVNQLAGIGGWFILAHELGHNMGAHHNPEGGQEVEASMATKEKVCQKLTNMKTCFGTFTPVKLAPR